MQPIYFTKHNQTLSLFGQAQGNAVYVSKIERLLSRTMGEDYILIGMGDDSPLLCYTPSSGGFVVLGPTDKDLGENAAFFDGMRSLSQKNNIPLRAIFKPADEIMRIGWPLLTDEDWSAQSWTLDENGKSFVNAVLALSGAVEGKIDPAGHENSETEGASQPQPAAKPDEVRPEISVTIGRAEDEDWSALPDLSDQDVEAQKYHVPKTPPNVLEKNLKAVRDIIQEFSRDVSFQIQATNTSIIPVRSEVVLETKGILPAILVHAFLIWLPISMTEKRSGFSIRLETDETAFLGYKVTDLNTPDTMFLVLAVSEAMTTIIGMNECELSFSIEAMRNWLKRYGHPTHSIDNLIG